MKKNFSISTKVVVLAMAMVLALGCGIGGTLAWLMDTTQKVTNTFTVGNVDIILKESPYNPSTGKYSDPEEGVENEYPAIPGATYKKDPVVAVHEVSENCYLFVEFKYTTAAKEYLNYNSTLTSANGWTQVGTTAVDSEEGTTTEVWYRKVMKGASAEDRTWELLDDLGNGHAADITLEIRTDSVTNQTMETAAAQKLEWKAYAVQMDYLKDSSNNDISAGTDENAAAAWELVKDKNDTYTTPTTASSDAGTNP